MAFGVTPHNLATSRMLAATDVPNRATCRLEEKEAEEKKGIGEDEGMRWNKWKRGKRQMGMMRKRKKQYDGQAKRKTKGVCKSMRPGAWRCGLIVEINTQNFENKYRKLYA